MTLPTPTFAVIGHPNEGKSSVVSTLTENDRIMITSTPGETRHAKKFPIKIDGKTLITFIDTPGFQHTKKILKWFNNYKDSRNSANGVLPAFIEEHLNNTAFDHDVKLLQPLADGAAAIFVVDASHPLRNHDRYEMEILRLTACPRMALINSKDDSTHLADWKDELNRNFNIIREFNAHRASFDERIKLLEALKVMHQNWESDISSAIESLTLNWRSRLAGTAADICDLLQDIVSHTESALLDEEKYDEDSLRKELLKRYEKSIIKREKRCHSTIRKRFRHEVFEGELETSVVFGENDLFSASTLSVLGLSRWQLTVASTIAGATAGVGIDLMLGAITFGVFTAGGAVTAGLSSFFGAKSISNTRIGKKRLSLKLGGQRLQLGPLGKNSQLAYILTDRALLYFVTISQWAHARRENRWQPIKITQQPWLTRAWKSEERKTLTSFINSIRKSGSPTRRNNFREQVCDILLQKMDH